MYRLGRRSRENLNGVHPDLVRVVNRAIQITKVDFAVIEGLRDKRRQEALVKAGASMTMNSRHLTGHAVDLAAWVDGRIDWSWPLYNKIDAAMKQAAQELDVKIKWGGNWTSFKDGPHFELDRAYYT